MKIFIKQYEWIKNIFIKANCDEIGLKKIAVEQKTSVDERKHWFKQNATVIVSLIAYFYIMWDFLIGRVYFSSDFYHIHLVFEFAYKALDKSFSLPTWLPLFQGGKAMFGDMANSYSPFGIDFIFTYVFSKLLDLDRTVGLVLIDTWRMVLLNVFFAFGCRQFAREFLKLRFSVDFVFFITLFVGASFLPHRPIFVIANVFSPWILLYLTRIVINSPDRWLHNLAGLTLAVVGSVFHQFNIQTTIVFPYIIFYFIGLLLFFPGKIVQFFAVWKRRFAIVFVSIVIIAAVLPLVSEYNYFDKYNRKILYPGETVESSINNTVYNLDDFVQERFEFQKLLSFLFPYPATLERVTNMTNGMPGMVMHNFQYFGVLAAILMLIGIIFSRNYCRYPVLTGIILYMLFATIERSPFFLTAWHAHVPMTRHFTFIQLHLAPLFAVLAGFGMDKVLTVMSKRKVNFWLGRITFVFVLFGSAYVSYQMIQDSTFSSANQGYLYSIFFILLTIIGILGVFQFTNPYLRFRVLFFIALIDILSFNHIIKTYVINSGRGNGPWIYTQSVTYDNVLPDISVLNNFHEFSPFPTEAYSMWVRPTFYFPEMYRYAVIGNKSFYDVLRNTTEQNRNMISGFTLPRVFVVDAAVEDPTGDIARKYLSNDNAEQIMGNAIFLNGQVTTGKDAIVDVNNISEFIKPPRVVVENETNFYDILPEMVSSNIKFDDGTAGSIFDNDKSTNVKLNNSNIPNESRWWFQVDFGVGNEKIVNIVKVTDGVGSCPGGMQCPWQLSFIEGSYNGRDWRRVGYLTFHDRQILSETTTEWQFINDEGFRYYKIIIEKNDKLPELLPRISSISLSGKRRRLVNGLVHRHTEKVPLLRFKNNGLSSDGQYYLFSYFFPRPVGVDISTNPTQGFGFNYKIKWDSEDRETQLRPAWDNNWHSENLFQIGYLVDGQLTINIPKDKVIEFRKGILDIAIETPDTGGVRVLDYGADNLLVTVERSKSGWLYYSDTWDKYWTATVNGEKASIYKANLQYKAVYIPPGKSTVLFLYKPKSFLTFIVISYILQFIILLVWFKTWQSKPLSKKGEN
ncbi:MAG: hypothetical protein A3G39_11000 [Deltaproteobacteria bacterium RIFCSPLOWO2_12_FULL_43_16]|nr:MAG: hypothetical protein A2Z89_09095 [Deltaproteobacteria bacterium GWA2_43_19]OGQ13129.1 MAG: hypothetical protein A3D30_09980 [Deltaproteobacteria bacterium RIFCSPHIGHO2_02_FULL_43_33]OGQ57402.1 MAG: hypothetical protein A3G39_11000 [Deltaproteobacteria bacterium RIFCSPLOWO2_12_FULL_43_16]HBR16955.1 hypothetical protein [Deltaproteobacteria bacterium]